MFSYPNMKQKLFFIVILFLASFLRFYKLDTIPPGLSQDETSIGYNAYSILKTGKDEHGVSLPQNFKAFGEYKLPGYIYLSTIPIAFFGPTPFAVRLPSAFFGILTVLLTYFLVKELFALGHKTMSMGQIEDSAHCSLSPVTYMPLLSAALLAINPWHLHLSRAAFEVTVSLFFIVAGFVFWLKAQKKSSVIFFAFSIICFSLAGYTYNIARLLGPLCLLFLIYTNKHTLKSLRKISKTTLGFVTLFSFGPMIWGLISSGGASSTAGTMIWSSSSVQAPLLEWRSYFSLWPTVVTKLLFNKMILTSQQFIQNFTAFFSPTFFFTTGSLHGNHGIGNVGQWYLFEVITIFIGSIWAIKRKIHPLIIFWILTTAGIVALTRESPHATRAFFIAVPVTILSSIGLLYLIHRISQFRFRTFKTVSFVFLICVCSYQIFFYFASYYVRFPILYAKPWRSADRDVSMYIKNNASQYDRIIFDQKSGFVYSSLLYYLAISPAEFQKNATWNPEDSEGFSFPNTFGKYEFRAVDWSKDLQYPKTLIITNKDNKPLSVPDLITFYYPERPVVLSIGQQLAQYPTTDVAYILVTKN